MICWNCGKEVPKGAKSCKHCESKIEDLPDISPAELGPMLAAAGLTEDMLKEMRELAGEAKSADEFANMMFVGDCPKCGSKNVGNCEETRGIEDVTVGRCFDCGLMWCAECGYQLKKGETGCPHWAICKACPQDEDCPFVADTSGCPKVAGWMESVGLPGGNEPDEEGEKRDPPRGTD